MDVGSQGFQQAWADNVLAKLESAPWDGVFMDDVNATIKYHHDPQDVGLYPDDASYFAATSDAVAEIAPRIRAAGKLAIANIGSWGKYSDEGNELLTHLSGGMEEMFVKWGNEAGVGHVGMGVVDRAARERRGHRQDLHRHHALRQHRPRPPGSDGPPSCSARPGSPPTGSTVTTQRAVVPGVRRGSG
jgi:hypothetical protein